MVGRWILIRGAFPQVCDDSPLPHSPTGIQDSYRPRLSSLTVRGHCLHVLATAQFQLTLESTPFSSIHTPLTTLAQLSPRVSFLIHFPLSLVCSILAVPLTNEQLKTDTPLHKTFTAPEIFRVNPQNIREKSLSTSRKVTCGGDAQPNEFFS